MKKTLKICLFDNKELERILKVVEPKKIKCGICKKKINKNNISAIFPEKRGFSFVCKEPTCFIIAVYKTKKLQERK